MEPSAVDIANTVSAMGLIFGAVWLFMTGRAQGFGATFRQAIEPSLSSLRSSSEHSREELAGFTVLAAVGFAILSGIFESPFGFLIAAVLYWVRPRICRMARHENALLAETSRFGGDLIIGLYVPVTLAQFVLLDWLMGITMLLIVVSLSWPAAGSTMPGRKWQFAPATLD